MVENCAEKNKFTFQPQAETNSSWFPCSDASGMMNCSLSVIFSNPEERLKILSKNCEFEFQCTHDA